MSVQERIGDLSGAEVVLVTFARQRVLAGFRKRLGLTFPVLADEDRASYRDYDLGRGPWWRIWGPATWLAYARLVARGKRAERPTDDTLQLGGDFVVASSGRLVYAFRSRSPSDRPPIEELVAAASAGR